ncbi:lipopolysaccharide-binding protein-like [Rhopilema esculentum]|uniref:lipopolysaccharide-binding protein-like n=1 Tax=Rhopilema esculentum TaxID=499914 RepID=UPI0031D8275D|eukprot:gene8391-14368_t
MFFRFPALAVLLLAALASGQQRGLQLRLTAKGLEYGMRQAMQTLETDLSGKRLGDFQGNGGGFQISVTNLVMNNLVIGNERLVPGNAALTAAVSSVTAVVSGRFSYRKKIGWVTIRDSMNIRVRASGVSFSLSARFGSQSGGRPTIGVNSCSAHIGSFKADVSGSRASWLYKIIASLFESKLRSEIAKAICKGATDVINTKGSRALSQFPVQVPISDFGKLDYRLTAAPVLNNQYMDVFVKGEFLPLSGGVSAPAPVFQASSDNSKMLYFWVSDYTLNSAADVVQKTGKLSKKLDAQEDLPKVVKDLLNTNTLAAVVPQLAAQFPNRPLIVALHSYKAPKFVIEDGAIRVLLYASAGLMVLKNDSTLFDAFTIQLDINAAGSVGLSGTTIHGSLNSFSFGLKIIASHIGTVNIPTDDKFVNTIVKEVLIPAANVFLVTGFRLPTIPYVALQRPAITFHKGVIRVGVDCLYAPNLYL